MRQLNNLELVSNVISGGSIETYPARIPGYELVGWKQILVGWDTDTYVVDTDFFSEIVYKDRLAIYDIQPIYAPIPFYFV